MGTTYKFAEGERVLCFHGPLIYDAKTLRRAVLKNKKNEYYVHYAGWSKNWDEWVPEQLVLKYNEANVQRQKELHEQHTTAMKNKKRKSKKSDSSNRQAGNMAPVKPTSANTSRSTAKTTSASRGRRSRCKPATHITASSSSSELSNKDCANLQEAKTAEPRNPIDNTPKKRFYTKSNTSFSDMQTMSSAATLGKLANDLAESHLDGSMESEGMFFVSQIVVNIKIPMALKRCLANDWHCIANQCKLIELPAKLTVQHIAEQYLAIKSPPASQDVAIADVLAGIVAYFDVLLGTQLLYTPERPQFADMAQRYPSTPPSQLYGAMHLLRLFVTLGSKLRYSAFDEQSMQNLLVHIHSFLKFLAKNTGKYFGEVNYVSADSKDNN